MQGIHSDSFSDSMHFPNQKLIHSLISVVDENQTNQNIDNQVLDASADSLQRSESTDSEKEVSGSTKARVSTSANS